MKQDPTIDNFATRISGAVVIAAAVLFCGMWFWAGAHDAAARPGESTAATNFRLSNIDDNHPRMRALVTNAFRYVAPDNGAIDAASGYPVEGWNDDPRHGLFLRSFTQLTAIGSWIELLANIAAGQADNPYISPTDALDRLALAVHSLRHDQQDPQVSANGLLGNFLSFDGPRRAGPLAGDVPKQDIVDAFGPRQGQDIWEALIKKGWIHEENKGQKGIILRGPQYGLQHFDGPLTPFADNATKNRLMAILDRRVVLLAFGDNANLSESVANAIGALLFPTVRDLPVAVQLRRDMEQFLEAQRPGYQFLFDPKAGLFRFGWNASTNTFFGWADSQGNWRVGHSDYLINEFRGPTMFVTLRYGLPLTTIGNLGVKMKPYRMRDGRLVYTPAPWEGSAFQALGLRLSMGELRDPGWRLMLKNFVDIGLDYAARHHLPGFLSEAYSGRGTEYTGIIGIPDISVSESPRITDAPSLYTLGVAYAIAPDGVEQLLNANWPIISQLLTDHGPWEGYNTTTREPIRFQTTVHVLALILGAMNTATDNMSRYLDEKGLSEPLRALYKSGRKLDLLSKDARTVAWTPDRSNVQSTRHANEVHLRGENVSQAGLTFVLPGDEGVSYSGGLLRIRYTAQQPIQKASVVLKRTRPAADAAGLIPSEISLDMTDAVSSDTNTGNKEKTIEIPLPPTPALRGMAHLAVVFGSGATRRPLDIALTALTFIPASEERTPPATTGNAR